MKKINMTPYARFLRKDELKNVLPREQFEKLGGEDNDLYGVVIDIKGLDKIDNPEIFMEYTFGKSKP